MAFILLRHERSCIGKRSCEKPHQNKHEPAVDRQVEHAVADEIACPYLQNSEQGSIQNGLTKFGSASAVL